MTDRKVSERTLAEMQRGREKVMENINKQSQTLAQFYLDKEFNPDFDASKYATKEVPGDKVTQYQRDLWARNKGREDFK